MKRFAISCLLGLGSLAVSQASLAGTWAEVGDAPDSPAQAQEIVGSNIDSLTGKLEGAIATPDDTLDIFKFTWAGGDLNLGVRFYDIQEWLSADDDAPTTYQLYLTDIFGTLLSNVLEDSTIFQKSGRTQPYQSTPPGDNFIPPDSNGQMQYLGLNIPGLAATDTNLSSDFAYYYLNVAQAPASGAANYTVIFSPALNGAITPPPSGSTPEPGTLALIGIGLAATLFNRRRSIVNACS
jgi:hypothetical protein